MVVRILMVKTMKVPDLNSGAIDKENKKVIAI